MRYVIVRASNHVSALQALKIYHPPTQGFSCACTLGWCLSPLQGWSCRTQEHLLTGHSFVNCQLDDWKLVPRMKLITGLQGSVTTGQARSLVIRYPCHSDSPIKTKG